jgi:hypothetical protein
MATLIDAAEFTSNEVYQIQATDAVEGAAIGASFSGTGISNQPHQQLANRTAFLKQRQDVDIANISTLLGFMSDFQGSMQPNGYVEIPFNDIARGSIVALVQWGTYSLMGQTPAALKNATWTVTWPIAFPNAAFWFMANWQTNALGSANSGDGTFAGGMMSVETAPPGKSNGQFFTDWDDNAKIYVASSSGALGLTGVTWLAIGF